MNQVVDPGEPSQPRNGQDVAGMRGSPHLQTLPDRSPLLHPGWQVTRGWAGHRDLISRAYRSLNQFAYAYGHTINGYLGDDENARGLSRVGKDNRASVSVGSQSANKRTAPSLTFMLPKRFHL